MFEKIGFIGCGNMASAMIGGIVGSGLVVKEDLVVTDIMTSTLNQAKEKFGVTAVLTNGEVIAQSQLIFLAVKPQYYQEVINEISPLVSEDQVIISIAPGITLEKLATMFRKSLKIVRTMPNTPALVGEGMTGICYNENVTQDEIVDVCTVFNSFGKGELVPEKLMDGVVAVSGSSPAYVFMFIEAMADAVVAEGMPRAQAYDFAAQAVLGSAKMVLETKKHPAELKDMVCSPAGATIEAVKVLEEKGFRSSVMAAMKACADKSREFK